MDLAKYDALLIDEAAKNNYAEFFGYFRQVNPNILLIANAFGHLGSLPCLRKGRKKHSGQDGYYCHV